MITDPEEVVAEVARKNGIGLRKYDMVMTLVTIMNRIGDDYLTATKKTLEDYQRSHEQIAHRWRQDATDRAEQVLNATLKASQEAMAMGMAEGAAQVVAIVRDEMNRAIALQKEQLKEVLEEMRQCAAWTMYGGLGIGFGIMLLGIVLSFK